MISKSRYLDRFLFIMSPDYHYDQALFNHCYNTQIKFAYFKNILLQKMGIQFPARCICVIVLRRIILHYMTYIILKNDAKNNDPLVINRNIYAQSYDRI